MMSTPGTQIKRIMFLSLILLLQEVETSRFAQMKQAAANPDLSKFLVIGALLFIIGVAGVLTRRNRVDPERRQPELHRVLSLSLHDGQRQRARGTAIRGFCNRRGRGRGCNWLGNRDRALPEQGNDLGR